MRTHHPSQVRSLASGVDTLPITAPAWWLVGLLAIVALLPRCLALADFYTIDESYHWPGRVAKFAQALTDQQWAQTIRTGHPGVTTLWLGTVGSVIADLLHVERPSQLIGSGTTYLSFLRLPVAVVNSLAIPLSFLLLRKLVRPSIALLAALLWATSPFLIGYSRLLHVDGLLTTFLSLSLVLLLVYQHAHGGWRALVGSAICAGLAVLTKTPALILIPGAALIMLGGVLFPADQRVGPPMQLHHALRRVIPSYLLWLLVVVGIVVLVWPAMWADPGQALTRVIREIVENGGQPTDGGNYFQGYPIGDPGALFYPAALVLRMTPIGVLGLLAVLGAMAAGPHGPADRVRLSPVERRTIVVLLFVSIGFLSMMSLEPKKFDRYLLPIWPALQIIAAFGLLWLADVLKQYTITQLQRQGVRAIRIEQLRFVALLVVGIVLVSPIIRYHPYTIAYYNPLLGGGAMAERTLLVGWGEGMGQVGAWLRGRPDLQRGPILSWTAPNLMPFLPPQSSVVNLTPETVRQPSSYAILYVRSVQRKESAEAEAAVRQVPPLYTLRMFGITYATIHQLPRPYTTPRDAVFGDGLHLRGFSQDQIGSTLVITPSWDIQTDQRGGLITFVHVLDERGVRVAQVDAILDQGMFQHWQAGQQFDVPLPIMLPAGLPAGRYQIALGLYRPEDGARIALTQGTSLLATAAGAHAILLTWLDLP